MASQATQPALAPESAIEETASPTHAEIEALAYQLWQERGCPHGSAEEDWLAAEHALRSGASCAPQE